MSLETRAMAARRRVAPQTDASRGASVPQSVPCGGHSFDEKLRCRCGASWWTHQVDPEPCPDHARQRNRQGISAADEPTES